MGITWLNERAKPYVEHLARELGESLRAPLHMSVPGQVKAVFDLVREKWGKLDILVPWG